MNRIPEPELMDDQRRLKLCQARISASRIMPLLSISGDVFRTSDEARQWTRVAARQMSLYAPIAAHFHYMNQLVS